MLNTALGAGARKLNILSEQRCTTFGVSVHGIEFDVIHVRNNENVLSLDFTHSSEAKESKHFMDDLQTLSDSIKPKEFISVCTCDNNGTYDKCKIWYKDYKWSESTDADSR